MAEISNTPFFNPPEEPEPEAVAEPAKDAAPADKGGDSEPDPEPSPLFDKTDPKNQTTVPLGRLQKETKKFHEAQRERNAFKAELDAAKAKLEVHEGLNAAGAKRYSEFDDPVHQMNADAQYMDNLVEAAKTNPDLAASLNAVGAKIQEVDKKMKTPETPATPERDPEIQAIIDRDAARQVSDNEEIAIQQLTDAGVKPEWARVVGEAAIAGIDGEDLSPDAVNEFAKSFFADRELTSETVLVPVEKGEPDPKPKTRGRTAPAISAEPTKGGKTAEEPEGPKTRDEWTKRHRARVADLADS